MSTLLHNRYQILQKLGSGGCGQTFLVEDTTMLLKRRCVIKQLKPVTSDPAAYQIIKERFHREAAILEKLGKASNQIPTLYDYFTEDKEFYLVQDWIEGENLSQRVRRAGRLSADEAQALLTNLLPVLEEVHSQGVIHRDIKPENTMLRSPDNKPILIDFGAVKEVVSTVVNAEGNLSNTIVIGTPEFMPLEQTRGNPVFASDLYSLGLTIIFALTGRRPRELATDHTGKISWRQYAPNVPNALAAVIDKAVMPLAHDRYKTAGEMYSALRPTKRETRGGDRRLMYAVILLLVLISGGVGITAYKRAQEAREAGEAKEKAERTREVAEENRRRAEEEAQRRIEQEMAAREAAEAKQKELEKYKPSGQIQDVWVDHNVFENNLKGMRIHIKFTVQNSLSAKCLAAVYFYLASGEALNDSNKRYYSVDGKVAIYEEFTPNYPDTTFSDFKLFMPYDELHVGSGKTQLKFTVFLFRKGGDHFAKSDFKEFTLTK